MEPMQTTCALLLVGILRLGACAASPAGVLPAGESERADDPATLVAQLRSVIGAQGAGSDQARKLRDQLAQGGPESIPVLLRGMDTPDTVAANWLRSAFDEVVGRAMAADGAPMPKGELERVVLDAGRQGRVRRLALDLLAQLEPGAKERLIPPLVDDPEFRRDAVAAALADAQKLAAEQKKPQAVEAYQRAFEAARDADQVRSAAAQLKSLGHEVSIPHHMGFLVDWWLIGPFHKPDFQAFSTVFPPERKVDLEAEYPVGPDKSAGWKRLQTPDEFGTVDLVKAIAATDDAACYGFTTVESPQDQDAQIRCGADDNIQIWLNGERVFAKEEWQNGSRLDRFIVPVRLRAGANEILVKVCQGPKYRDPGMSNPWSMQVRICDSMGKGMRLNPAAD